jgi:external thioesterase TEII
MNKIIAFPFAGGSKYSFQSIAKGIPGFCSIEYPGRGARIKEGLISRMDLLIADILPAVLKETMACSEYIFYGHSMGALVAHQVCYALQQLGKKLPSRLVVSGSKPPTLAREEMLSGLPDMDFWEAVKAYGGIPTEFHDVPELIEYFLPVLKNDFAAIETYKHTVKEKLPIPVDGFYGSHEHITADEMQQWEAETTGSVTIKKMEGNHFFLFEHIEFFTTYFKNLQISTTISIC